MGYHLWGKKTIGEQNEALLQNYKKKKKVSSTYISYIFLKKYLLRYSLYFADKSQFVKSVANTFSYKRKREKKMFLHFW